VDEADIGLVEARRRSKVRGSR